MLERHDDIDVLAEAGSVNEAVELRVEPDVVVANLVLPDDRGAAPARQATPASRRG